MSVQLIAVFGSLLALCIVQTTKAMTNMTNHSADENGNTLRTALILLISCANMLYLYARVYGINIIMPSIVVKNDKLSDGDETNETSPNVLATNVNVVRKNDLTYGIGSIDTYPVPFAQASPNVFANNIGVVRVGDQSILGPTVIQGALSVACNTIVGGGAVVDNNVIVPSNGDVINPVANMQPVIITRYVASNPTMTNVAESYFEKDDSASIAPLPSGAAALQKNQSETDTSPAKQTGTPSHTCSDVESLPDTFNWVTENPSYTGTFTDFQNWSQSFQLSTNYSVYDLTMGTAVSRFMFATTVNQNTYFRQTQKLTLQNLCFHVNTLLEDMLSKYGTDMIITSAFRAQDYKTQHTYGLGGATDIQFLSFHNLPNTPQLYFQRAQEIRDTFNFDQMILEWYGYNPWIHISTNSAANRHNILTQVEPNTYQSGLILLS